MDTLLERTNSYFNGKRGLNEEEEIAAIKIAERGLELRRKKGRYTLEEAAVYVGTHAVGTHASVNIKNIYDAMNKAISEGSLTVHQPGDDVPYDIKERVISFPWADEIYWDDLNSWLKSKYRHFKCIFPNPIKPKTNEKVSSSADWKEQARIIADECFDKDTELNCRDKLKVTKNNKIVDGYAYRVMVKMQERGIHGPNGLIDNPATVMREALQGDLWWKKKRK